MMTDDGTCDRCGGTILPPSRIGAPRGTCACQPRSRPHGDPALERGVSQTAPADTPLRVLADRIAGLLEEHAPAGSPEAAAAARIRETLDGGGWVPMHTTPVPFRQVAPLQVVMTADGHLYRALEPRNGEHRAAIIGSAGTCEHGEKYCSVCHRDGFVVMPPDIPVRICTIHRTGDAR